MDLLKPEQVTTKQNKQKTAATTKKIQEIFSYGYIYKSSFLVPEL